MMQNSHVKSTCQLLLDPDIVSRFFQATEGKKYLHFETEFDSIKCLLAVTN